MRQFECEFEADVLSAVIQSRWPERVDAELREHAKTCAICSDVAMVAGAIECAREESAKFSAVPDALPDSGRVWWKAQMRARREAVEAVGRPITAIQVAAFAFAIALMGACIGATSSAFQAGLQWTWAQISALDPAALIANHGLIIVGMAAMIFGIPVAVYLAVGKE